MGGLWNVPLFVASLSVSNRRRSVLIIYRFPRRTGGIRRRFNMAAEIRRSRGRENLLFEHRIQDGVESTSGGGREERARASKNFHGGLPAFHWDHFLVSYIKMIPRLRSIYWCKKCTKKEKFQISIFSYVLHFSDVSCILRCDLGFRAVLFGKLIIGTLTLISALDISPSCARELETIDSIRVS